MKSAVTKHSKAFYIQFYVCYSVNVDDSCLNINFKIFVWSTIHFGVSKIADATGNENVFHTKFRAQRWLL